MQLPPRLDRYLLVLAGLMLLAVAPLTAPGYFSLAHDARHIVYLLQMFDATLRDGAAYPRWAADMTFGYGYPVWVIFAPLPYYLGEALHLIGLDLVSAAKGIDALALIGSGLAMYLFARRLLGRDAGLLASVAYVYIPYHLVDLYVRAATAEFLSFVFPPLILWALYELILGRRGWFGPLAALAYAALVLTHAQMALLFSPLIGLYALLLWAAARRGAGDLPAGPRAAPLFGLLSAAAAILLGVFVSAAFLLPVMLEQRYLTQEPFIGGFFNPSQHFVSLAQLLSPFWGYGYAGINGTDQFSLQLGVIPIFLGLGALFGRGQARPFWPSASLWFFALATLAAILLMLPLSAPIWQLAAPLLAFVQFPWRLLEIAALCLAVVAGSAVLVVPRQDSFLAALFLSLLFIAAMFPYARPQYTDARFNNDTLMDFEVQSHELLGDTVWLQGDRPTTSPLVAQYRAGTITEKATVARGEGRVELLAHDSQGDSVRSTSDAPVLLEFYTHYFPGWTVTVDGQPVEAQAYGEQGLIAVEVPEGTHVVTTRFGDTPVRQAGELISMAALAITLAWLYFSKRAAGRAVAEPRPSPLTDVLIGEPAEHVKPA